MERGHPNQDWFLHSGNNLIVAMFVCLDVVQNDCLLWCVCVVMCMHICGIQGLMCIQLHIAHEAHCLNVVHCIKQIYLFNYCEAGCLDMVQNDWILWCACVLVCACRLFWQPAFDVHTTAHCAWNTLFKQRLLSVFCKFIYLTTANLFGCGSNRLNIVVHLCFGVCMQTLLSVSIWCEMNWLCVE